MRSMQNIWKEHAVRKIFVLTLGAAVYALLFSLGSQIDQAGVTMAGTTLTRFAVAFPIAWGVLLMLMGELIPKITCVQGEEKNFPVLCANLSDLLSRYVCIRYAGAGRTGRIQPVYDVSSAGAYPVFRGMPVPV